MDDLTLEERSLLDQITEASGGYSNTLVEVFPEEVQIANVLISKGLLKEASGFSRRAMSVYLPFVPYTKAINGKITSVKED